jgi:hypothetical protein
MKRVRSSALPLFATVALLAGAGCGESERRGVPTTPSDTEPAAEPKRPDIACWVHYSFTGNEVADGKMIRLPPESSRKLVFRNMVVELVRYRDDDRGEPYVHESVVVTVSRRRPLPGWPYPLGRSYLPLPDYRTETLWNQFDVYGHGFTGRQTVVFQPNERTHSVVSYFCRAL